MSKRFQKSKRATTTRQRDDGLVTYLDRDTVFPQHLDRRLLFWLQVAAGVECWPFGICKWGKLVMGFMQPGDRRWIVEDKLKGWAFSCVKNGPFNSELDIDFFFWTWNYARFSSTIILFSLKKKTHNSVLFFFWSCNLTIILSMY